jgi:LuxR family maltose regulon positive regulatory protein
MSAPASALHSLDDFTIPTPPRTLVSTRLYPPRLRANLVTRPHLVSALNDNPDRRLTLICAPAGYGKSTLVAQWLADLALPSAWATLEAGDNDPHAFFGLIVAALHSIDRGLAPATAALLNDGELGHADAIVHQLVEELSATTRSFVLVLDDYHTIEEPAIHQAMDILAQHLPLTMQLVLISRTRPPLRLARLHVSGELLELGRSDLQFTTAEALKFYQDYLGLDLMPSQVLLLQERVEGWVTGLQLVGFALRGRPRELVERFVEEFVGNADFGDRYLWEEVLQRQPDDVQSFLLRTSVLDRFTAELCDAVTEHQDGDDMIRRCERDNLFIIPLDRLGSWHRYHHLFADALRERLSRVATDGEIEGIHRRASEWLEANGQREDAIRHAIAGQMWDWAVGLLEDHCAMLFEHERVASLLTWLQGLPPKVVESSPRLAFWLAWAFGRTGQWSKGLRSLRVAEESWTAEDDPLGRGLVLLWYAGRSLYARDNRRAIEFAQQALDLFPADQPTERIIALMTRGIAHLCHGHLASAEAVLADVRTTIDATGRSWLQPFEMAQSAAVLALKGELLESTVLCRRVIQAAGDRPTEFWVVVALLQLGEIYLEWGLLDDAERCFRRADDLAEMTHALQWPPSIRVGLARVAWAQGRTEDAFDEIEKGIGLANQLGSLQEVRSIKAQQARFWLASRQLALARRWADSCGLDPYLPPEYERQVEHLTYVRLLLQDGRADLALRILQRIDEQAEATGRQGQRVEILLLTALAHKVQGNSADAFKSLHGALELGAPGGYLRLFVDEGEDVAALLRHAAGRVGYRDYAQRLLAEIGGAPGTELPHRSGTPEALSERELQVLRLVAAGLPNREIGQSLFISEKTVKTHLSNIMGKLGAINRTQAVEQARRLGLF